MENTARNSTNAAPDTRRQWRKRAVHREKMLKIITARIVELEADYDALETELKALLTPTPSPEAHEILLSLTHHDLALLADEYRAKYLTLQTRTNLVAS